jgi:steroid 5-alpha reductase family enzyme
MPGGTKEIAMKSGIQLSILAVIMLLLMSAGWLWQRRHRNAGIVDVLWSAGLGIAAVLMAVTGDGGLLPRVLLALLGGAWATRLGLHIWRRVRDEEEDGRYRHLRTHWHGHQGKFYAFFQFQAVLVLLFALPFAAVARNPVDGMTPALLLGVVIWLVAVIGEFIADRQLARFRADPANHGRTCRDGLWRYSRHPNYFFEWVHWFAYVALAHSSPIAWLAWSGPLVMYVFLRWISGIPYTEAQALRSRGDDYRAYQRDTPMLIPRFFKSSGKTSNQTLKPGAHDE